MAYGTRQVCGEPLSKKGGGKFQLENSKTLEVKVDGSVMAKAGSMAVYTGEIEFDRKSAGGLKSMLKSSATGEGTVTMEASGKGNLYLADQGKEVQIIELGETESIRVNGNYLSAFESKVEYDIKTSGSLAASSSGGMFNVYLEGPGMVAITTYGKPLVLETPGKTDPQSTVAWSGNLSPSYNTDIKLKGFLGRSSGEEYQMEFTGDGFVVVQPFEELAPGQQQV